MTIKFTPQQDEAIREVVEWLNEHGSPQLFRLFGYAGTGKTTIAKEVAGEIGGDVMFGAFTGKAAQVMRNKGCSDAQTIHSMIYDVTEGEGGEAIFSLKMKGDCDVSDAKLVIIDECSMVGEELARDLMSFGTKILVIGDPAQLPPVKGSGFFTEAEPDVMLTEIHRQARENPIIAMSMTVREGGVLDYGAYGSSRVISRDELEPEEVLGADQVLVGLNRTRTVYNQRMRQLIFGERFQPLPLVGDKLVCLRNDRKKQIFNGGLWKATDVAFWEVRRKNKKPGGKKKVLRTDENFLRLYLDSLDEEGVQKSAKVRREFFLGQEGKLEWTDKIDSQEFTYGWTLTVHKSQGSQFDNVLIFDESAAFREDARRHLYTAITRAAQKVTVVR